MAAALLLLPRPMLHTRIQLGSAALVFLGLWNGLAVAWSALAIVLLVWGVVIFVLSVVGLLSACGCDVGTPAGGRSLRIDP